LPPPPFTGIYRGACATRTGGASVCAGRRCSCTSPARAGRRSATDRGMLTRSTRLDAVRSCFQLPERGEVAIARQITRSTPASYTAVERRDNYEALTFPRDAFACSGIVLAHTPWRRADACPDG
jgi:hypothetical protein